MEKEDISRRLFLIRSLVGVSGGWLLAKLPDIVAAQEHVHKALQSTAAPKLEFFTPEQAADVEAIAARIIPSDDTPGAREARVIFFIDRALTTFDKDKQPVYLKGLKHLNTRGRRHSTATPSFSALDPRQQDKLLKQIEKSRFFETVRTHTVMGFFSNPEYGGNHDLAGWKLIGFEDRFFYKPPFGYYDAGGQ
jgi:gluconate 2-dehydrogenase gamma chain